VYLSTQPVIDNPVAIRNEINDRMAPSAVEVVLGAAQGAPPVTDKIIPFDSNPSNGYFDLNEISAITARPPSEFTGDCNFLLVPGLDGASGLLLDSKFIGLSVNTFITSQSPKDLRYFQEDELGRSKTFKRIAAHEFGHFLTMSTREWTVFPPPDGLVRSGHDNGLTPKGTGTLMRRGTQTENPGDGRWTRHEDWEAANKRAGEIVQ
jgi:hypothetical protein